MAEGASSPTYKGISPTLDSTMKSLGYRALKGIEGAHFLVEFTQVFSKNQSKFPDTMIEEGSQCGIQKEMLFILLLHLSVGLRNFCSVCKFYLYVITHGANH